MDDTQDDGSTEVKQAGLCRQSAKDEFRFFDKDQHQRAGGHEHDIDIWVESAQLYVRLSPPWRRSITRAADRFRGWRESAQGTPLVLHYDDNFCDDVLVVSRRKLVEVKGNRIAIHDGDRDIFVLLPEEFSRRVIAAAHAERGERDSAVLQMPPGK